MNDTPQKSQTLTRVFAVAPDVHIVTGVNAPGKAMFSQAQQGGKFALTGPGLPAISSTANRWWERKIRISGHDVGMWGVD